MRKSNGEAASHQNNIDMAYMRLISFNNLILFYSLHKKATHLSGLFIFYCVDVPYRTLRLNAGNLNGYRFELSKYHYGQAIPERHASHR